MTTTQEGGARPAGHSRKASLFVVITVLIDAIGIGVIMPVMPDLMRELRGVDLSEAALWGGAISVVYAVMQFVFGPVIGNLSDAFGRRPVLLCSLGMLVIDYVVMGFAGSIWVLFVARALAGIAGATYSTANAYIADVSPPAERAANFGMIGAAFGVGFVIGPALGGLAGELDTRAPFFLAAVLAALNFAYGWFVLPESLPAEKRRPFDIRRANPFGALAQVRRLPGMIWFVLAFFLFNLAHNVYPAIWSYFSKEAYAWANWQVGLSLAAVGVLMALVQGWLIRIILRVWREPKTVIAGLVINLVGMGLISLTTEGWMFWALAPLTALGLIVGPALHGIMSNRVDGSAQGELQGILSAVGGITAILSPLLMTQLFGAFTGAGATVYFPGAPFLAAALLAGAAIAPFLIGLRGADQTAPD